MTARRLIALMAALLPVCVSAASEEEILLASLNVPRTAAALPGEDAPSPEWVSAMQDRWGQTTDIRDMRGLRDIQQAVVGEINAVYDEQARETPLPGKKTKAGNPAGVNVPEKIQAIIRKYARKYQISEELVKVLIRVESGFNPRAVSPKGAKGLMQLMPVHTIRNGIDPFDAEASVNTGLGYLSRLLDKYGDLRLALAAYNAGETAVDKYGGIPPYKETQRYVTKIMALLGGQ